MITIPTTELIGCLSAVLPITIDPKDNSLAGVAIGWNGDALTFTVYDVFSGAAVTWTPGEGAEGDVSEDDEVLVDEEDWGGHDEPWRVFINYTDAKEIVKLFKLPAKLWRHPVRLKVTAALNKLIVERDDLARGERLLTVSTDNDMLRSIPDIRSIALKADDALSGIPLATSFNGLRLASLGASSAYGVLTFAFGDESNPAGALAGKRYAAFVYPAAANPRPFNLLRDGAGVVTRV